MLGGPAQCGLARRGLGQQGLAQPGPSRLVLARPGLARLGLARLGLVRPGLALLALLAPLCACAKPPTQRSTSASTLATSVEVKGAALHGSSMQRYVSEPGLYVDLYRPHGAIDFTAPLPFHFTLLNTSEVSYDPWEFSFEFDGSIDHTWNATITQEGGRYVVRPDDWNAELRSGQTRQFGFVGRSNDRYRPGPDARSYRLGAVARGAGEAPEVTASGPSECELEVEFVVYADGQWWDSEPHSFFGEFYLRNVGTLPAQWALQWSMDHRGASGPGTRSVGNWARLTSGEYYLRATDFEGPIEPGGTRSFAIWGQYPRQPYDLLPCPQDVRIATDPAVEAHQRAYDALTDEEKRAVACGSLVWNGTSFTVRSPLSGMAPPCR